MGTEHLNMREKPVDIGILAKEVSTTPGGRELATNSTNIDVQNRVRMHAVPPYGIRVVGDFTMSQANANDSMPTKNHADRINVDRKPDIPPMKYRDITDDC